MKLLINVVKINKPYIKNHANMIIMYIFNKYLSSTFLPLYLYLISHYL